MKELLFRNRLFVKSDRSVSHEMLLLQNFQFLQNPRLRLAPELEIFFRCVSLLETLNFESRVLLGLEAVDSARQDGVVPIGKYKLLLIFWLFWIRQGTRCCYYSQFNILIGTTKLQDGTLDRKLCGTYLE